MTTLFIVVTDEPAGETVYLLTSDELEGMGVDPITPDYQQLGHELLSPQPGRVVTVVETTVEEGNADILPTDRGLRAR